MKALKSSYNRIEQMATLLVGEKMCGEVSDLMEPHLDVAQFGRALDLGSRGWGFESLHSDQYDLICALMLPASIDGRLVKL